VEGLMRLECQESPAAGKVGGTVDNFVMAWPTGNQRRIGQASQEREYLRVLPVIHVEAGALTDTSPKKHETDCRHGESRERQQPGERGEATEQSR
jgi:hypothetical protein